MITLTFTQEQFQIINAVINELPHRVAAPLLANINKQIQIQFDKKVDEREEV